MKKRAELSASVADRLADRLCELADPDTPVSPHAPTREFQEAVRRVMAAHAAQCAKHESRREKKRRRVA